MSAIWNLIAFIVAIGILVTIHEYGHYIVARWCKVKVLKFSIGFGKSLYSWRNKHNTEFSIAAIPLGGYVRMLDSRMDEVSESDKSVAFDHKPVSQRIAVVAAGPLFNLLFAVFALWAMLLIGTPEVKPVVGSVITDSPVATANIEAGDEIIAVNQQRTQTWQAVNIELMDALGDDHLTLTIQPKSQSYQLEKQVNLASWQVDPSEGDLIEALGIMIYRPKILAEIAKVEENSPASLANLQQGDIILQFAGQDYDWITMSQWIRQHANQELALLIERDNQQLELSVKLGVREQGSQTYGYLGVAPKLESWPQSHRFELRYGLVEGLTQASIQTWRLIELSFSMVGKLITGDVSYKSLSGPISIAQGAGQSAGLGIAYFLSFLALISVNLGIINLLPLPVLDGGHLVYYLIEFVTGRAVPEKVQEVGFRIGVIIIFSLMSIAIVNDLSRW
ncbi:sigma E protease regulator RseP [Catenovulum sp. 2E275]|uniref:sigma E protease regulator RseP n=1 Tax=Catenovulum sp. 2E275 TaxID=2980497 RepID=UPI0021CFB519|nr:sigma E protease regulator RseP [Catenovulum sp. 2E275]MCU4675737.1 sigma E protease regulator RseP [Catenovulum sp. 2E275]